MIHWGSASPQGPLFKSGRAGYRRCWLNVEAVEGRLSPKTKTISSENNRPDLKTTQSTSKTSLTLTEGQNTHTSPNFRRELDKFPADLGDQGRFVFCAAEGRTMDKCYHPLPRSLARRCGLETRWSRIVGHQSQAEQAQKLNSHFSGDLGGTALSPLGPTLYAGGADHTAPTNPRVQANNSS
jgi:hypothetical protein